MIKNKVKLSEKIKFEPISREKMYEKIIIRINLVIWRPNQVI